MRGPGDLFGIRQSGILDFQIADPFQDAPIMQWAGEAVDEVLRTDPGLQEEGHRGLEKKLRCYMKDGMENLNL